MEYFNAMLAMSVPNIELHIYGNGRHPGDAWPDGSRMAGGLTDRSDTPFGTWQYRFIDWYRDLGFPREAGCRDEGRERCRRVREPALRGVQIGSSPRLLLDMLKLKHLQNPLRTARIAKSRLGAYLEMRHFAADCQHFFRDDPRYGLNCITEGFKPRPSDFGEDAALLTRDLRLLCEDDAEPTVGARHLRPIKMVERGATRLTRAGDASA